MKSWAITSDKLSFSDHGREELRRDSDYDILLLVEKRSETSEDHVDEIAYEMLDRYGAVVTIFVDEIVAFQQEKDEPLFCNIRQGRAVL